MRTFKKSLHKPKLKKPYFYFGFPKNTFLKECKIIKIIDTETIIIEFFDDFTDELSCREIDKGQIKWQ